MDLQALFLNYLKEKSVRITVHLKISDKPQAVNPICGTIIDIDRFSFLMLADDGVYLVWKNSCLYLKPKDFSAIEYQKYVENQAKEEEKSVGSKTKKS